MGVRLRGFLAAVGAAILGISALTASPSVAAAGDFISTWDTTRTSFDSSGESTIELPLIANQPYNFAVTWGDGQSQTVTSWDQGTHTYAVPGVYTITISDPLTGWSFQPCDSCAYNGDRTKVLNISQWGDLQLGNTGGYFSGAENLNITATDSPDLAGTTDLHNAFRGAVHLTGGLDGWDTTAVTTMSGMFDGATLYNEDLSGWDTGNVTSMSEMFRGATAFNQPIGSWDTGSVTELSGMFQGATSFHQPLEAWDTSKVTSTAAMFAAATSFNQPLAAWDMGAVTNMAAMFAGATKFNQPIGGWDTSQVTGMGGMFREAMAFNQPLTWDTAKVTYMGEMFKGASSFNQPIGTWDTSAVTSMTGMFWGSTAFNQNLGAWDVSQVTDTSYMFGDATAFNGAVSNWDTGNVQSMTHMFASAVSFNQPIGSWDVSGVTSMEGMLAGALAFNQNLGAWNVGHVTDMKNLLNAVNLSVANYNSLLNGWAALPVLQGGVEFGAGNNHYTSVAAAAHNHLIQEHAWTIHDGGILNSQMNAVLNPTDFGGQDLGFSGQRTITVSSGGPPFADLIFGPDAVSIGGPDAAMFAIAQDNCSGKTMPPGGDVCTVTVDFTPTSIGAKTAELRFASNSPQSPYVVSLIGTGLGAAFTADPQSLTFGQQLVGTSSAARVVTISNTGNKDMAIGPYNVKVTGADAAQFTITAQTCRGALLTPGQTCTISVVFIAVSVGERSAYLEILDSAPGAPHTVGMTGTAFTSGGPTPPPVVTPPAAPTGLTVKAKKKAVKATWKPATGAHGYRAKITGKTPKNKRTSRTISGTAGTAAKFGLKLKAGSTFKVCVSAFNSAGTSPAACKKGKVPR